jgi:hypothetical protein
MELEGEPAMQFVDGIYLVLGMALVLLLGAIPIRVLLRSLRRETPPPKSDVIYCNGVALRVDDVDSRF